ncbi:MAG: transglutaminase domain-containing protein [[Eubacterium] siraeum]
MNNSQGKSYHHIQLETLGEEYTSRREAAYEKAKSVVASIPQECNTDRKKAQYLYNYVAENSVYVTDGYSTRNVPIADLLIDGKAICDGYADTVTMLFNMAGIETASANGTNNSKNEGHTVNFAKLDGEYYYFDASCRQHHKRKRLQACILFRYVMGGGFRQLYICR